MSYEPTDSRPRSGSDIAKVTSHEHLELAGFENDLWYPDHDLYSPALPGVDRDELSASYILQVVEALSRPRGAAECGNSGLRQRVVHTRYGVGKRQRKKDSFPTRQQIPTRNSFEDMSFSDRVKASNNVYPGFDMLRDSSDEEAASSIRTYSSLDDEDDDDWGADDVLGRKYSDALLWNNADAAAVKPITLLRHTTFPSRLELLQLEHVYGIQFEERWNIPLLASTFLGVLIVAVLFGLYWARSRSDIQGAFAVTSWIVQLAAIIVAIRVQRDSGE